MKRKLFFLFLFLLGMCTRSFSQFSEGFENGIPSNWTIVNGSEVTTWDHISTTVANMESSWIHSGTGAAGISRYCCFNQDDYLITPAITVVAGLNDRMSFWCGRFVYDNGEGMEVAISTTTPDAAGMEAIDMVMPEVATVSPFYTKYTYDLSAYVGQTIYVGFHAINSESWRLCIDDFKNDALPISKPVCTAITYPQNGAVNVDPVGVLKWAEVPGVVGYKVTLGTTPGGGELYEALDVSDVTTKIIGPLELATTYYVKVLPYNNLGIAVSCTEYSFTTRNQILGDFCTSAIDLSTLTSPHTSTTTGAGDDDFGCYIWSGPDIYYTIQVPAGATLNIRQTFNDYESANSVFYGDCTNRTEIYCGITGDLYSWLNWQNTTGQSQTVFWVQYGAGWNEDQNDGAYTFEWSVADCDLPSATFKTVSNCNVAPGFFIDVDVTDMGSLTSLKITDNQGSPMQTATATGPLQFGPYALGTAVLINVTDVAEASCTISSNLLTLASCPPLCSEATVVTVGEVIPCVVGSGAGGWDFSNFPWFQGKEKLFSFTPTISGKYHAKTVWDGESLETLPINPYGLFYKAANASCDTGWNYITTSDGFNSQIGSNDLIAGTEYLLLFDAVETAGTSTNFEIIYIEPCDYATMTHTVISECTVGAEYFVDVNITSMGTATEHTLYVGMEGGTIAYGTITETGIVHLGPFPYASRMSYQLVNNQTNCPSIQSGHVNQLSVCPDFYPVCPVITYPANNATNVELLSINSQPGLTLTWDVPVSIVPTVAYNVYIGLTPTSLSFLAHTTQVSLTIFGLDSNKTYYWKVLPQNTFGIFLIDYTPPCEVYSFTTGGFIPNGYCMNGGQYPEETFTPVCDGPVETVIDAYAGDYCNVEVFEGNTYEFSSTGTNNLGVPDLITIGSEDGLTALAWGTSPLTWTATISGPVRFYAHLSNMCQGQQLIRSKRVSCATLSTPTFDISALKAYPNPVENILNLTYIKGINSLSVFNVLGQEVMSKSVNAIETTIDMQSLPSGNYFVKVITSNDEVKTINVIRK